MERLDISRDKFNKDQFVNNDIAKMIQKRADLMTIKPEKRIALPIGRSNLPGHTDNSPVCRSPLTPFPGSPFGLCTSANFPTHLNAEALGRSLSCPNTPLFSPLLGTWADDTEKYFPEFQYSGSGGAPQHLSCPDRPIVPHLDDDFPQTPLSPAVDMFDASSPFGGGTDDEDDDAMSNHSFFSNPHSIGKSHHSADAGRNEETHAADGVGHQPNSADGMDFNRHGSPEASRTNSHAPSRLSPTMPSGELPEAKIREEEHKNQLARHPPVLSNGVVHDGWRQAPDAAHPFPSISSSLQELDHENFAAAFAQTFQADSSPRKSFTISTSAEKTEIFHQFDHNSRGPPAEIFMPNGRISCRDTEGELPRTHTPKGSPPASANASFAHPNTATSPTQRSTPSCPSAPQGHPALALPVTGPNVGPPLFPKAGTAGAVHHPPANPHPMHPLAPLSVSLTPPAHNNVPTPSLAPKPTANFPAPSPQMTVQVSPPFGPSSAGLQAFPGMAPNGYHSLPAGPNGAPFGGSHIHTPLGPAAHTFPAPTPSIAQTMNQALKNNNHHPKALGSLPFAAADTKEPAAFMAPPPPPTLPYVADASRVSVGNPSFVPGLGLNNNCTIFIAPGQPATAVPQPSQSSKFPSPSRSPALGPPGLGPTAPAMPASDNVFLGPPAPPHPQVSPAMSPGMVPAPMITIVPNTLTPAASGAQGGRQGKGGRAGAGRQFLSEFEAQLTETTILYLQDETINPFRGSVPVERIQNVVRSKHADLYNTVVGTRHNSWRRYVERHPDVFHLFSVEDGKWRMRLIQHENWEEGDRQEQVERQSKEQHLITCLSLFLERRQGMSCKVDEFMESYPTLPPNLGVHDLESVHPLPARGDLVRFVRRHACYFMYDPDTLSLSLKPDSS